MLYLSARMAQKFKKMANSNEETKKAFLENLPRKNYHIGKTCEAVGLKRRTFYNWLKEDSKFKEDYEDAVQADIDDSEEKMKLLRTGVPKFEKDKDGKSIFVGWTVKPHFGALLAHLESKAADRGWGRKLEITNKTNDDREMTDEELIAEMERLNKEINDDEWDTSKDGINGSE